MHIKRPKSDSLLAQHQYDWQKLMLIAGKNSALIDKWVPHNQTNRSTYRGLYKLQANDKGEIAE